MLKDITLGQFFPGNSAVNRLDPRVLFLLTVAFIVLLLLAQGPVSYALIIAFLAVVIGISRISPKMVLRGLKPILFIVIFTAVLNLFYTQGTYFILSTHAEGAPDAWNQVKEQNESATASTCLGFALDVTNIQNEVANCNTVWDKYKNDLLPGASDPATAVPACIEELKAAGLDTVIEEAQKQEDEIFAN